MDLYLSNLNTTASYLDHNFRPKEIALKRLSRSTNLPDILVISDLDGSKWGDFKGGFRSAYNLEQTRKNGEAFNQYKDRFLVADVTAQDILMTKKNSSVYGNFEVLDFLANSNGLELRINQKSKTPESFINEMPVSELESSQSDWQEFISKFWDKKLFHSKLQEALKNKGFKAVDLETIEIPDYIYKACHELYRSSAYPNMDISISPGEASIVIIDRQKGANINKAEVLLKELSDELKNKLDVVFPGEKAEKVIYHTGKCESYVHSFFTHADQNKQIDKATFPQAVLKMLPANVLNAIQAIICIGDGSNDRHLALKEVQSPDGNKKIPVYRLISGRSLYDKNPEWLNITKHTVDKEKEMKEERVFVAENKGDIGQALHHIVQQIDK